MFIHNFKYSFKTLFKNKMLIFWTFAFPIILGTFFNLAFSNIENSEKLDIINIAIIENEEFKNNEIYIKSFKELSDEKNENRLFSVQYTTEEAAKELLQNNKIIGYMILEEKPKVVVKESGINENLSYTMIEFYTLIAMACLYGGILGMVTINQNLANMSNNGKRVSVAPTSKGIVILSSVLASYIAQLIGLTLLFIYTIFVLKVDYGTNLPLIILLGIVGSLAGLSMGIAIATLLKTNENVKTGIVISVTMLGCFLSGMMGITMKYIIDKNMPIINKINPASMITDGFYSLYYYDTLDRFYFNIASLLVFAFIMIVIAFLSLRRQKYDSI